VRSCFREQALSPLLQGAVPSGNGTGTRGAAAAASVSQPPFGPQSRKPTRNKQREGGRKAPRERGRRSQASPADAASQLPRDGWLSVEIASAYQVVGVVRLCLEGGGKQLRRDKIERQ
jgi:hypothetical protein